MTDLEVLETSLGYILRRAQLSTYKTYFSHMEKFQIRPAQFVALVFIRTNPGLTQTAVSVALGIQKANFVSLLDGLEKRGLTERRKVGRDRRLLELYLTKAGEAFVKDVEAAHARHEAELLSRLGPAKTRSLFDLLKEFTDAAPVE